MSRLRSPILIVLLGACSGNGGDSQDAGPSTSDGTSPDATGDATGPEPTTTGPDPTTTGPDPTGDATGPDTGCVCDDDGNACTTDHCVAGACVHDPVIDGTDCDDGDACTTVDACQSGACTGGEPVACTAMDACHDVGVCDPATGLCSDPQLDDGTPCSDEDTCTSGDTCLAGACVGTTVGMIMVESGTEAGHTCGVTGDGHLWCWGDNADGQVTATNGADMVMSTPVEVTALPGPIVAVDLAGHNTCAIVMGGSLYCWGANNAGQLGNGGIMPSPTPVEVTGIGAPIAEVALGYTHVCARTDAGAVWCWGGAYGHVVSSPVLVGALGTDVLQISAGFDRSCAVKEDGTLHCWGAFPPGTVTEVTGFPDTPIEVSVGYGHQCALLADQTLWCWGWNADGQLGVGNFSDSNTPVQVVALGTEVAEFSAQGYAHTCARTTDRAVWCWGADNYNQLGDGLTSDQNLPQFVGGAAGSVGVGIGSVHSCVWHADGQVWCWGANGTGNVGIGTISTAVGFPSHVGGLPCP